MLLNFSKKRRIAEKAYRAFVSEGRNLPSPWDKLCHQIYLGDDPFIERAKKKLPASQRSKEIAASQCQPRPKAKSLRFYDKQACTRNEAIEKMFLSGGYTMKEIDQFYGLHYSTISRIIFAREKT